MAVLNNGKVYLGDTLLSGGGAELPTLENPGTAVDLASGKQLIDADGNVVTGSVNTISPGSTYNLNKNYTSVKTSGSSDLALSTNTHPGIYYREGADIKLTTSLSSFGTATPDQVAKGATFTSGSGLLVEGTHECDEGVALPNLTNPGSASDLAQGKQLIGADGSVVTGNLQSCSGFGFEDDLFNVSYLESHKDFFIESPQISGRYIVEQGSKVTGYVLGSTFGNATAADVAQGKTFTSADGLLVEGTGLIAGGGSVYPDGAFAAVTSFTDGKQYALVAVIDGVHRYINTTTYNDYTMNATQITIAEDAGDYVIFSATPALFTAVASGDGFLLKNGSNYLHGTSSGGTALRVGTTQAVWTVDNSATGGFSEGKYNPKENDNAVWLINNTGGYNWSIKYETAGSFGYDREGRDNTYSTGFIPFVLCELVEGESAAGPVVDTSDATATAADMAKGVTSYVNGKKVTGSVETSNSLQTLYNCPASVSGDIIKLSSSITTPWLYRKGVELTTPLSNLGNATAADVAAGKTFTSTAGLKVTGTATSGGGSVVKTGTTTSATIATGLSSIEAFFIYKESVGETGLIHLSYSSSGTSYLYASAWTTNSWGSKTIANGTTAATVNGGSITIPGTSATNGALSSGKTYNWVAIGK